LRPLTPLKWPYVPEESAYPDLLKRDDPKAIADGTVRRTLISYLFHLQTLRSIDRLWGPALEEALSGNPAVAGLVPLWEWEGYEEKEVMRELTEVIGAAVRRNREDALGLGARIDRVVLYIKYGRALHLTIMQAPYRVDLSVSLCT
ncbi:hypothetical protein BJV78DRAFT_1128487, partial [Lactifluus subvellereus]